MQIPKFKPRRALPKTLGTVANYGWQLEELRKQAAKLEADLKSEIARLSEHAKPLLRKAGVEEARGTQGKIISDTEYVPQVADWKKLYAFIRKSNAFELLHRRTSSTAFQERWDLGKRIPGVERIGILRVKFRKAPRR